MARPCTPPPQRVEPAEPQRLESAISAKLTEGHSRDTQQTSANGLYKASLAALPSPSSQICALWAAVTLRASRAALATQTLPTARDRWENSSERASVQHGAVATAVVPSASPPGAAACGVEIGASPPHLPTSLRLLLLGTPAGGGAVGAQCSPQPWACPQSTGSLPGPDQ